jgi:hypothetical protein
MDTSQYAVFLSLALLSFSKTQTVPSDLRPHTYMHNPGTQPQRRAVEAIHVMNHAVTLSGISTNRTMAIKLNRTRKRGVNYRGDHMRKHDNGFKA